MRALIIISLFWATTAAAQPCSNLECLVKQQSAREELKKERHGVWIERPPQPQHIIIDQTIRLREDSVFDRMFPPEAPKPAPQQHYILSPRERHENFYR